MSMYHPYLVNVVDRMPANERWTHYYTRQNSYTQLDYLFVSRALANSPANRNRLPVIVRNGMPRRAARYQGPRLR